MRLVGLYKGSALSSPLRVYCRYPSCPSGFGCPRDGLAGEPVCPSITTLVSTIQYIGELHAASPASSRVKHHASRRAHQSSHRIARLHHPPPGPPLNPSLPTGSLKMQVKRRLTPRIQSLSKKFQGRHGAIQKYKRRQISTMLDAECSTIL